MYLNFIKSAIFDCNTVTFHKRNKIICKAGTFKKQENSELLHALINVNLYQYEFYVMYNDIYHTIIGSIQYFMFKGLGARLFGKYPGGWDKWWSPQEVSGITVKKLFYCCPVFFSDQIYIVLQFVLLLHDIANWEQINDPSLYVPLILAWPVYMGFNG